MNNNTDFPQEVTGHLHVTGPDSLPSPAHISAASQNKTFYLLGLLIIVITLIAYSPLPWNKFIIYDDPEYVTENLDVLGGLTFEGLVWAFRSTSASNWHPLTWLSHMLDIQLYGLNPVGHHITSILLHVTNSLLVLTVLRKMTGSLWRSALVAILFAVHPLHVESVAWVAERKDLLCALFWLLTIRAYLFYVEKPGWKRYLLILVSFALGAMSKPMIVTLPCILFLLDYWPLRRKTALPALIAEKIPLFMISAGCSIITYRIQMTCGKSVIHDLHAQMNALQAYVGYLLKTVWPMKLAVLYPFDVTSLTAVRSGGAALILLAITIAVILQAGKRQYLLVGWFWYLGALVPVIGIFRIGFHSMADRYTYLPHIGLFIMLIWGVAELTASHGVARRAAISAVIIVTGVFCLLTFRQVQRWENTITLMRHTVAVTDNNWYSYNNLGCAYHIVGITNRQVNISASLPLYPDTPERRAIFLRWAIECFSASLRINPEYPTAAGNLKLAVKELNKLEQEQLNAGSKPAVEN